MEWSTTRPAEDQILMEMPPPNKKELQAFQGIINYLDKFSPSTASICESPSEADIKQSSMGIESFISGPL